MELTLQMHIVAGVFAIGSGFVALYSGKGTTRHRRAGLVFFLTMLIMCFSGLLITLVRDVTVAINVPAALLTAYLVITALTTVRPVPGDSRWLDLGATGTALAVGLVSLALGLETVALGGSRDGIPAFPFFLFGVTGLLGGLGDMRVLRSGRLQGAARLSRHLWRMCFALFFAALSLFLGQAKVFPEALRASGLLNLPILAVLLTMLYWLWRVRTGRFGRVQPHPGSWKMGLAFPAIRRARHDIRKIGTGRGGERLRDHETLPGTGHRDHAVDRDRDAHGGVPIHPGTA